MSRWNSKISMVRRRIKSQTRVFHQIFRKLKKFLDLPFEEKRLFLEAYFSLGIMRFAISLASFKFLTRALEPYREENSSLLNHLARNTVAKISQAIHRAAIYTPWESSCLIQALTAQKMLQKRGIPGAFYLGVAKDDGKLLAHAWSRCGNQIVTGGEGHNEFRVLSTFLWEH